MNHTKKPDIDAIICKFFSLNLSFLKDFNLKSTEPIFLNILNCRSLSGFRNIFIDKSLVITTPYKLDIYNIIEIFSFLSAYQVPLVVLCAPAIKHNIEEKCKLAPIIIITSL